MFDASSFFIIHQQTIKTRKIIKAEGYFKLSNSDSIVTEGSSSIIWTFTLSMYFYYVYISSFCVELPKSRLIKCGSIQQYPLRRWIEPLANGVSLKLNNIILLTNVNVSNVTPELRTYGVWCSGTNYWKRYDPTTGPALKYWP